MSIAAVIDRMTQLRKEFAPYDPRLFFHDTYLRTTQAVAQELGKGLFVDPEWVEEWDVVFADLYVDALRAHLAGSRTPSSWAFAFDAALHRQLPPLRHVLLGMNAHINNDLPQALLAAVSSSDFDDPALIARREQDHRNIDAVLLARVAAEDAELSAISAPSLSNRLLRPFNQRGTKHSSSRHDARSGEARRCWTAPDGSATARSQAGLPNSRAARPTRLPSCFRLVRCCCDLRSRASASPWRTKGTGRPPVRHG